MKLDDDDTLAEHYNFISDVLKEYGFHQYEISNFAKSSETESTHNINYWRGGTYIGLGVGAHGFDGRRRSWNTARLQEYLKRIAEGQDVIEGYEDLTEEQRLMEKVLFGLRMNEGVNGDLVPVNKKDLVQDWISEGFLILENGSLKATRRGRLVLDELSARLI